MGGTDFGGGWGRNERDVYQELNSKYFNFEMPKFEVLSKQLYM